MLDTIYKDSQGGNHCQIYPVSKLPSDDESSSTSRAGRSVVSATFKPSFLIQGLLDTFTSQESSGPIEHHCFVCQQIGKTTQAKSVCEDCDILLCEACAKIHQATPVLTGHLISQGTGSTQQLKKRKFMCKEHNCPVELCCRGCQKAVCQKCSVIYHRECRSVVTLESMIPEMKQILQQNNDQINSHIQQTGITLKSRRSQVEEITRHKSSLQSEIRRVSQQAMDLIRRKENRLMDELDTLTGTQTGQLKGQIKSGEIDLQTYQQYSEFIKQVLQSESPMDLYNMYTLCQSGEITAELQRNNKQKDEAKHVFFERYSDVDQLDKTFQLGNLKYVEEKVDHKDAHNLLSAVSTGTTVPTLLPAPSTGTVPKLRPASSTGTVPKLRPAPSTGTVPKLRPAPSTGTKVPKLRPAPSTGTTIPKLLRTVSTGSSNDRKHQELTDIEVLDIDGIENVVATDARNKSVKSCYTRSDRPHCTSLAVCETPFRLTKFGHDRVAVSYMSYNSIELIKLTPDPVLVSSIKTKKKYKCLTALSDKALAAGCGNPPSIDVLDLSGRVLKSVITPSTGQQLIQHPWYMCTTRQGNIVVADVMSGHVNCVTQQGTIVFSYKLASDEDGHYQGVSTTDTDSVIVADWGHEKIIQLTERGEYVRDLLTEKDGIAVPRGLRVHGNKVYVTGELWEYIKVFQM